MEQRNQPVPAAVTAEERKAARERAQRIADQARTPPSPEAWEHLDDLLRSA
jgi:hypothetical protein